MIFYGRDMNNTLLAQWYIYNLNFLYNYKKIIKNYQNKISIIFYKVIFTSTSQESKRKR